MTKTKLIFTVILLALIALVWQHQLATDATFVSLAGALSYTLGHAWGLLIAAMSFWLKVALALAALGAVVLGVIALLGRTPERPVTQD